MGIKVRFTTNNLNDLDYLLKYTKLRERANRKWSNLNDLDYLLKYTKLRERANRKWRNRKWRIIHNADPHNYAK